MRFGSIWDDPNGFAFVLTFLIPFVLATRMSHLYRGLLTGILLLAMLLTQSLTGIFSFAVALISGVFLLALLLRTPGYWKQGFSLVMLYALGAILALTVIIKLPIFQEFLYLKSGSIDDHLRTMGAIHDATLVNYLGLRPADRVSETGYINLVYNFGVLYFLAYVAMLGYSLVRLMRKIRENQGQGGVEVYYGAFFYVLSFAVGMLNLPLDSVFPLNLILVACILVSYRRSEVRPPEQPVARTELTPVNG
ncbi:hypothetical protein D3C87_1440820 [compost metagenome]